MENIFGCDVPRSKGRKQGLINTRLIIYILGVLVLVEAGLFALCAGVSLLYEEPDYIYFVQTMGINIALGGSMVLVGKRTDNLISRRDGYCIVSVSWLLFTALGMLPFYFSGYIPSVADAFFETDVSATYFSLNLQILFSLSVMYNCIYILLFLCLADTL